MKDTKKTKSLFQKAHKAQSQNKWAGGEKSQSWTVQQQISAL